MKLRVLPQGLFGRLTLILLAAIALALIITAQFVGIERQQLQHELTARQSASRIADAEYLLRQTEVDARPALIKALAKSGIQLEATSLAQSITTNEFLQNTFSNALAHRLSDTQVINTGVVIKDKVNARFTARLRSSESGDRQWSTVEMLDRGPPPPRSSLLSLAVLLLTVTTATLIVVRWVAQPLSALADAARALGTSAEHGPIAERGPTEIRQAIHAFNDMRERINRMVEEKMRMLAAISHDLRAPITRMRLRVEMLNDAQARTRLIGDLDELRRLTDEALDFLRGTSGNETMVSCNLVQLVQTIAQEAREAGHNVAITAPSSLEIIAGPNALRRCVQNLVDNTLKYANGAEIELATRDATAWLWVRDRGLGMSEAELAHAFEPFYRGDPARGHAVGFGLGLPIARAIARQHGGDVLLQARVSGGIEAELQLPLLARPELSSLPL